MKLKDRVIQHKMDPGFAGAALLSASLVLGGCGGGAQSAQRQAPPPVSVAPLEVRCLGERDTVGAGQSLSLGPSPRASYVFRINSVGADAVNADVSVPVMITEGPNVFTFSARFNGVRFGRSSLESAIGRICARLERDRGHGTLVSTAGNTGTGTTVGPARGWPGLNEIIARMVSAGSVNRAIGIIANLRSGNIGDDDAQFRVLGSSDKEYHVRIERGQFRGQVFTLDRNVEFGVDRFEEPEGHLSMPMRILEMHARSDSYGVAMMIDCVRPMEASFPSMIEYEGINPACGK